MCKTHHPPNPPPYEGGAGGGCRSDFVHVPKKTFKVDRAKLLHCVALLYFSERLYYTENAGKVCKSLILLDAKNLSGVFSIIQANMV
jgi:hypothetical protein